MTKRIGCIVFLFCAAAISAGAQTFTTVANFNGTDGSASFSSLVQGADGSLYGTTAGGGDSNEGTVFKLTPRGTVITLHSFCSEANCADGASPYATLMLALDGNFYGATYYGGANNLGSIFKITPQGTLTTLYSFCSQTNCSDGQSPFTALIQATDGNFYGSTTGGGIGPGTIFKMTPQGALATLYSFCSKSNCADGEIPDGALIQAVDGDFYGTTEGGGGPSRNGTVFKVTPQGSLTTLYKFCSEPECADGKYPEAALTEAADGSFYGTTFDGGAYGEGTIFKVTTGGTLTTLYSFNLTDGAGPSEGAGLVKGLDGNFYGETTAGGADESGTLFEITTGGTLTTLHNFETTEGDGPVGGLVQSTDGNFYGTTPFGGTDNDNGTVFSLSVGLGRFIETIPVSGTVGESVTILGNDLKGSTAVSFNGTQATTFTTSNTAIRVTVPTGTTSGSVEVVTASGKVLQSNAPFRIIP